MTLGAQFELDLARLMDRILRWVEFLVVVVVVVAVCSVLGYLAYWIIVGPDQDPRQQRLQIVAKLVNENWKVGLLLLVPLFYRPVRVFLEEIQEGPFGTSRQLRGREEGPSPNPPRRHAP